MDLYKILPMGNWQKSQSQKTLLLTEADNQCIHFSTEEQLERIVKKYWSDGKPYVILKVDSTQLLGQLIFEANPGGTNKYYHLYEGAIPLTAIQCVYT